MISTRRRRIPVIVAWAALVVLVLAALALDLPEAAALIGVAGGLTIPGARHAKRGDRT